ncbi:MAG: DUF4149 domain-containing protein [Verrucomicrobia bacterium]|nr:DUF4149 domain-containing protein [Verrucomicrobiota bacterium]
MAPARKLPTLAAVILVLRVVGLLNAAVWLGAAIFFTMVAAPAFFSPEMTHLLGRAYSGAAAQIVVKRYFIFHLVCSAVAIAHLVLEWLYCGKPLHRWLLYMLLGVLGAALLGGFVLTPKMKQLHYVMYARGVTPAQQTQARSTFGLLHGLSQVGNLAVLAGLLVYFWQVNNPNTPMRFFSGTKFRG